MLFLFFRQYAVNVKAVMNVSQVVAKKMIERKQGGCIINVSSLVNTPKNILVFFLFRLVHHSSETIYTTFISAVHKPVEKCLH